MFVPKAGEIAGFDMIGWKQTDGTFILGDKTYGRRVDEFPQEVHVCDVTYTLEFIKWNTDEQSEEILATWTDEQKSICWGVYV